MADSLDNVWREGVMWVSCDELFSDMAVIGIPVRGDEYSRKMPGESDANGDHCA